MISKKEREAKIIAKWNGRKTRPTLKERNAAYRKLPRYRFIVAKHVAKKRGLKWKLSLEQYTALVDNAVCFYGKKHVMGTTGIGLDRKNNNKGYTVQNVVPCCTACNIGRHRNYTVEEWQVMTQALEIFRESKNK